LLESVHSFNWEFPAAPPPVLAVVESSLLAVSLLSIPDHHQTNVKMLSTAGLRLAVAALVSLSVRAQDSAPTGPTFPNMAANCNAFHTVVSGDGCWSITVEYGITLAQFYEWNPDIADDCGTNFWLGSAYCVGVGAALPSTTSTPESSTIPPTPTSEVTPPSSTTSESTTITTTTTDTISTPYTALHPITEYPITTISVETEFPPTRTQSGQPASCTNWYLPGAKDTCGRVIAQFSGVDADEFLAWNPALGEDCGGLYAGWWVCVGVRTTRVYDPDVITEDVTSVEVPTATSFASPTWPTIPPYVPEPTHADTVAGCLQYAKAEAEDTCHDFADGGMLTEAQFFELNPGLDGNCEGLWANYYYCIIGPSGILNYPSPTTTVAPTPSPSGQTDTCVRWFKPGTLNCAAIARSFGSFSEAEFIAWNPSVGPTCKSIRPESWYCIGVPATPSTRTTPLVPEVPTTTGAAFPTQTSVAATCEKWWFVGKGDTCNRITYIHDLLLGDFLAMNPGVGTLAENTCENLERDIYVCVSVGDTPTTSAAPPTTTGAVPPASTPTPVQVSPIPFVSSPAQTGRPCRTVLTLSLLFRPAWLRAAVASTSPRTAMDAGTFPIQRASACRTSPSPI
jgi:hypothetical protein